MGGISEPASPHPRMTGCIFQALVLSLIDTVWIRKEGVATTGCSEKVLCDGLMMSALGRDWGGGVCRLHAGFP